MKKVYKDHTFKCPCCKGVQTQKAWSDDPACMCDTDGCNNVLTKFDLVKPKAVKKAPGIRTPTKNRV